MQQLAGEITGQTRQVGRMQGAIGNQYALEMPLALLAVALADQLPALWLALHPQHAGVELVMLVETKLPGVVAKVAAHLAVVRVGRHLGTHGEFAKLGGALGGNQVRRVVHAAVRVIDIPQATDVAVQLEANEIDTVLLQLPGRAQAHGAGTYDGVHGEPRYCYEWQRKCWNYCVTGGGCFNDNRRL